jgi:hypothetical protein
MYFYTYWKLDWLDFITECRIRMDNSSSLTLFRVLKEGLELSVYLMKIDNFKHRQIISKLRMSSHCLNIEYGRHRNIERQNRLCELCDKLTIADEFHFVLECTYVWNIFQDIIGRDLVWWNKLNLWKQRTNVYFITSHYIC